MAEEAAKFAVQQRQARDAKEEVTLGTTARSQGKRNSIANDMRRRAASPGRWGERKAKPAQIDSARLASAVEALATAAGAIVA